MVLLFGRDKLFSKTFLLHLSFLHIFDSDVAMSIQPLYWTLAVEVQFYLFLILAAPLLTGESGMRWLLGLVAGNILYRLLIFPFFYSASSHTGLMLGNILPGRIGEFAYGMIIAKMFIERVSWIEYLKRPLIMGVTALMTVILVSGCWIVWLKMGDAFLDWWLTNALLYPAVGLGYGLLFVLVLTSPLMNRIMSMRCIVFTGTISYSIYLWHVFSLKIADNILTGTGGFLVSLITTLIISTFSYYFIEKTFLRLKAR
jgi:peptidoglycan/LPS O-acetylase OafA/YrhL